MLLLGHWYLGSRSLKTFRLGSRVRWGRFVHTLWIFLDTDLWCHTWQSLDNFNDRQPSSCQSIFICGYMLASKKRPIITSSVRSRTLLENLWTEKTSTLVIPIVKQLLTIQVYYYIYIYKVQFSIQVATVVWLIKQPGQGIRRDFMSNRPIKWNYWMDE